MNRTSHTNYLQLNLCYCCGRRIGKDKIIANNITVFDVGDLKSLRSLRDLIVGVSIKIIISYYKNFV